MKTTKMLTILVLRSELLRRVALVVALAMVVWTTKVSEAAPMGTAFTYQGRLIDADTTADGLYDFAFKLYDANAGGSKAANDVNVADVDVIDGYFTVELDFDGSAFNGDARWLEIGVRPGELNDSNAYSTLSPRQEVTPTPYALYAKSSGTDNDWMVSGNDMYSIPSGNVGIGETNPSEKLEVNGNININSVYKIGGDTVLSVTSTENTLVGVGAGKNNTGNRNTFLGSEAGPDNTGSYNTFLGYQAGKSNNTGWGNTFSGSSAGYLNTTGTLNTAVGFRALQDANTGSYNSAVGSEALRLNTSGWGNSAMGSKALFFNTTGERNSAMGNRALYGNTTGRENSAVGASALEYNITGSGNSAMGFYALYHNTEGLNNSAMGSSALWINTTGKFNSAMGAHALSSNDTGMYNLGVGCQAGLLNATGNNNTFVGAEAGMSATGSNNVFLGYQAGYNETGDNKLYIANDSADANVLIYGDFSTGQVGIGTTSPTSPLTVNGSIESTTNGFKFPNGTTQTTAMGSSAGYTSGPGSNPSATIAFLSPIRIVTITSSGQRIYVSSNRAFGSIAAGGAANLNLYIGYRVSGSVAVPTTVGGGCFGMSVPQSTRVMMGLSAIITGLAPGTYEVGLAGRDSGGGNWNSNEWGYTTAFVF